MSLLRAGRWWRVTLYATCFERKSRCRWKAPEASEHTPSSKWEVAPCSVRGQVVVRICVGGDRAVACELPCVQRRFRCLQDPSGVRRMGYVSGRIGWHEQESRQSEMSWASAPVPRCCPEVQNCRCFFLCVPIAKILEASPCPCVRTHAPWR